MKIVEEKMYKGHQYQVVEKEGLYYATWDCGGGIGNFRGIPGWNRLQDALNNVHLAIDCYVDRYAEDILLFGDEIKVGARLYSHETNEKCTVTAFNGSSMTVKFDNGDTQEFGSDYAFDVIYDFEAAGEEDGAQYDIVCEGHTSNGMKFQIITDSRNKDKGYGFAVDIWDCFEEDYTKYRWHYSTLQDVVNTIESEYSKDKDKLELLKEGEYALIRRIGSSESELIEVQSIDKDTIVYRSPGMPPTPQTGDISLIVPLAAEVIPWTAEELSTHVGDHFRLAKKIVYMATGYDGNLNCLLIPKVGDTVYVSSDTLIQAGYEVKTDEGWKPCYNVKWKE